jgi:hypothetical protein
MSAERPAWDLTTDDHDDEPALVPWARSQAVDLEQVEALVDCALLDCGLRGAFRVVPLDDVVSRDKLHFLRADCLAEQTRWLGWEPLPALSTSTDDGVDWSPI